jgi:hypothetical protein
VIGIRWGKRAPTYANGNDKLSKILREYLTYACGDDEWTKGRVLEAMRLKTGTAVKADARQKFPSLFPRNRKARPLGVPDELKDQDINFDIACIEQWKQQVKAIKKEIIMNENATASAEVDTEVASTDTETKSNSRVTVNFFIPEGVSPQELTLENYRELTGKRFRMNKDQAQVRSLTREVAFEESKALAISQLGVE